MIGEKENMARIDHEKLKNEKDIFKCYKCFEKENIISDKKLAEKYEKDLIELLKTSKFNSTSLDEFIYNLENTNPFDNGYVPRSDYSSQIENRLSLFNQDKIKNKFNYYREDDSKGNSLETMIQRHIMLSDKYNDVLGKPLFYEFPCNTYLPDTEKEKRGKVPIDLITYDEDKKILYLIELKKCRGSVAYKNSNLSESKELFLRAVLEISTYYSFFTHLLEINEADVLNALNKVGKTNIKREDIKEIRKAVLAPKTVFDNVYTSELKPWLSKIDCFTIDIIPDDISEIEVNTPSKIFDVKKIIL